MLARDAYADMTVVPRAAISLPLAVMTPDGFRVEEPQTWPSSPGRYEFAEGRLWYMPPCGDEQQRTVADVVGVLAVWRADHPEFVVGTNEAGMLLGGEVRAADAAVRRRADLSAPTGGFPRVAPILAIEVAGRDDTIELLSAKARWYLSHGTAVVWLLDPPRRVVHVVTPEGEHELGAAQLVPPIAALPGLRTTVAALFAQLVEG